MEKVGYFKIDTFSTLDGPGVRMVVFLNGCQLRCVYCHNPECFLKPEKFITSKEIIDMFIKNKDFYKNGGITISGGEPTLNYDFCLELAKLCKKNNISLCIDTNGHLGNSDKTIKLASLGVIFLIDIKHTIESYHKKITGSKELKELDMIDCLEKNSYSYIIRYVYGIGLTDQKENLDNIKKIISNAKHLLKFELLPLHLLATHKYKELKMKMLIDKTNVPSDEQIKETNDFLLQKSIG